MARKGWYEALTKALKQCGDSPVMQLATIEKPSCTPRTRSLVHRTFVTASTLPALPLILTTTDIRTPKVTQIEDERRVELAYWTPSTQEQFRILGRASIVPEPGYTGPYPSRRGIVYDALEEEGFDWEAKRREVFDEMSPYLKATWCRPVPGTPIEDEDEMKKWPERLPRLGEANGLKEDERNLAVALSNFALMLVEPVEVDYVELGTRPDRRTRFERDWEDERVVEFTATLIVP